MERYAWKAVLLPGMLNTYIDRHNHIWPEMRQALKTAGIRNYTIWNIDNELFGYYECDSIEFIKRSQEENSVFLKWKEYMKDIMVMEKSANSGAQLILTQVFFLD